MPTDLSIRKRAGAFRLPWRAMFLVAAPLGLLAAALPAHLEKTYIFQTTPSPLISLSNLSGQVVIKGWEKTQVRAVCSTVSPGVVIHAEPMPSTGLADKVRFESQVQDTLLTEKEESADYTLDVPLDSSLEIRDRQGRIEIQKLSGDAWVESVAGAISVSDVSGHLAVRTIGGDIEVIRPSGRVEASSITGSLHFINPASTKLRASTTSGRIVYEGDFLPGGDYVLSEYSGEMDIRCPASASFELNAKSVRGKVISDPALSLVPRPGAANPPSGASSFFGTHNSGNATVELTSFSGNIHIQRQP